MPAESTVVARQAASFRDPAGSVLRIDGRTLRVVHAGGREDLRAFLGSRVALQLVERGSMVSTSILEHDTARVLLDHPAVVARASGDAALLLEHETIPFASYPYEWPPEMLHAAAALTLEIARALLGQGLGLKDATPSNVLFRGARPVFVDVLSAERRDPRDPTWLAYAQFIRTFLLPLLASVRCGIGLDRTLGPSRDGLEPELVYRWLSPWQRMLPPGLTLVTLPVWLGRRHKPADTSLYERRSLGDPEQARYVLESLLTGLDRSLGRLEPRAQQSAWSDYDTEAGHYTAEQRAVKEAFVSEAMTEFAPRRVLDVGCNTGRFSFIAARAGAAVVAIDQDAAVVGRLWREASVTGSDILPLVVNLARPTPGAGWRNQECESFLDRARGAFDAVLMLAVLHHLLVSERVPLLEVLDLAADLTRDLLLIEFVAPEDPMFRRLTRGRDNLYLDLTRERFEDACLRRFDLVRSRRLGESARWLYVWRKKPGLDLA